jgi:Fur family ferric uptake transcriptional regulator
MSEYLTRQRKLLMEYMKDHPDENMSAAEIFSGLNSSDISLSAVYRNLRQMEEEGRVTRITRTGSREAYYQYVATDRCREKIHLVCKYCGRAEHLSEEDESEFINNLTMHRMFSIDLASTVVYGTCYRCRCERAGDAGNE